MKTAWLISVLMGFSLPVYAVFPTIELKSEWIVCEEDSDCIVAGDACRSCGQHQIIHKKFKATFIQFDLEQRKRAGEMRSCEACSTAHVKMGCVKKVCKELPPGIGKP